MPIVFIRKEATGEIRKHIDDCPWDGDYMWESGNYSCDCNRFLFFERARGEKPAYDDGTCGDEAYAVRIEDESGKELYRDDRWEKGLSALGQG